MSILVLNCGSSSVKFAVLDPASPNDVPLSGLFERVGSPQATATIRRSGEKHEQALEGGQYADAFALIQAELSALGLSDKLVAVGHRVVHGGAVFSAPARITPSALAAMRTTVSLAPLHNPANIAGIEAAQAAFPNLPQVAVFDTAFHQTMPAVAYRYAVPEEWYARYGVRRYGFHGTSHEFVAARAAEMLGQPLENLNLITAHLGNGCSVCAVAGGKSVDTSMGLTPLDGLMMGTRSGDVDPGLHDYMHRQAGLSVEEVTSDLNKKSGLLGVSGLTNDMRELEAVASTNEKAKLALEMFVYRLAKAIAQMAVALSDTNGGKIDGLVFTGGIGENSDWVRAETLKRLRVLGFEIDEAANKAAVRGKSGRITAGSGPAALVVNTNEELAIARETAAVVGGGER